MAVAERMLNDLRISVRSMREIGEEQRGQIIISSIMSVANGLLPAIVAKYRASRPGIALFSLHKQLIQGHGITIWQQGFAVVNALIFGKVILIGQALEVGKGLERHALVWGMLGKSLTFAILLLAFHIAEEAIRAVFKGQPLSASFADFGGSLPGLVTYAAIFFVALILFFAFQEAARVLGGGALWNLFFRAGEQRFRLIEA